MSQSIRPSEEWNFGELEKRLPKKNNNGCLSVFLIIPFIIILSIYFI